ncbi:unnamed protein product [Parajaminaea phylloscopi]
MSALAPQGSSPARYPPRKWYRKVPLISTKPIDEPLAVPRDGSHENPDFPEMRANWLSLLTFYWLHRVLKIGYTRPLNDEELYTMPDHRRAKIYADRLEKAWDHRCQRAAEQAAAGKTSTASSRRRWVSRLPFVKKTTSADSTPKPSLALALNDVVFSWFWLGGVFKLISDLATISSPVVVRYIIRTLGSPSPDEKKRGFGLSVALFLVLVIAVFGNVHGMYRSISTGIALRGALIHVIYKRGCHLSERARSRDGCGVGKLVSLVSADVSRIDFCAGYFHMAWTSVVQMLVCLALTLWTLSYSALPGFALIAIMYPTQRLMVRKLFALRRLSMPFTDARIKGVVEAVSSIRLVKTYAWEAPVLAKIASLRGKEMNLLRKRLLWRSLNTAVSFTVPTLAAVVSLICYSGVGNSLQADVVFTALSFFLLLRTPLQMLPVSLSAIADAQAAIERLSAFMHVELRDGDRPISDSMTEILSVQDALFVHHDEDYQTKSAEGSLSEKTAASSTHQDALKDEGTTSSTSLYLDTLTVQRGAFVAVVGPVGSGKSSLLRALIGDLREVRSKDFRIGAHVAYCPQTAWLLSATVRDNIVFDRPFDQAQYDRTVAQCCLGPDFASLSEGDLTVVGEKGVSLSGGQKQRISLARAVYSGAERPLRLLDDCFSALDAQVGAEVFRNVVLDSKSSSITHILVTHSLAIVPHADKVIYVEDGRIVQQGSYGELIAIDGPFARLMGQESEKQAEVDVEQAPEGASSADVQPQAPLANPLSSRSTTGAATAQSQLAGGATKAGAEVKPKALMQKEERLIGSVTWRTYLDYVLLGQSAVTVPLFVASILFYQGCTILSPLWLMWWQQTRWSYLSEGTYMGTYAALGLGQSLGLFCMSASFALFAFFTSQHLHARAAKRVLHAPLSFFDTTPQGRITHRFSKDIDAVDNVVGETLRLFISVCVQALGSIILVAIILPWFLIIAFIVVVLYVWVGMFYRPASRELRRLNNVLRSRIYEHFSESLMGITTLRTYGAVSSFLEDNARRIDTENKAYWLSIACQRWLNLRLDFLGAVLVFGSALLVVGLRGSINASSGGVVLSYMVTVQSVFGQMIRQSAEIENNMNSIERLLHYANKIEQERAHVCDRDEELEKAGWPQRGEVSYNEVVASHRKDLPPALRNVSFTISAGQRIGVVGRTGAGKSTLLSSLLRIMEPTSGSITVDGVDVQDIGLSLLRRKISVISQDAVLFAGTLRYNLDPFEEHTDADLWAAMKQARLIESDEDIAASTTIEASEAEKKQDAPRRLHLDMNIAIDGSNLSQGQRSLVSIARALVKEAKILVLDEATASVDVQTDAHIQTMLQTTLRDCTFITVAHRLDTIIGPSNYICVMDQGRVAEYAPPEQLWQDRGGLFRQLCESANISETDFSKMRSDARALARRQTDSE